ncbi:MAG: chromate transporter [Veillonellales bacterium]
MMNANLALRQKHKVSLWNILIGYLKISLASFGGSLSAWAQLIVVEERKWLTDEEFLSSFALCRILPGPNQVNFAIYVGLRLRGASGALAALSGLIVVPFFIVVTAGIAYFHFQNIQSVVAALKEMSAVAVGMTLGMGVKLSQRYNFTLWTFCLMLTSFFTVGVLRWPLLPVLAVLIPLSVLVCWRNTAKTNTKEKADE